jgi:hypothetical protein
METIPRQFSRMVRVKALRALGEEQHEAGDHAASVTTLAEGTSVPGIN